MAISMVVYGTNSARLWWLKDSICSCKFATKRALRELFNLFSVSWRSDLLEAAVPAWLGFGSCCDALEWLQQVR